MSDLTERLTTQANALLRLRDWHHEGALLREAAAALAQMERERDRWQSLAIEPKGADALRAEIRKAEAERDALQRRVDAMEDAVAVALRGLADGLTAPAGEEPTR